MEKYKPKYLGKILPEDPAGITDFVQNKFDSFSEVFDVCKDNSDDIKDLKLIKNEDNSDLTELSVKLTATYDALEEITKRAETNDSVNVVGNVVTASVEAKK